MHHKEAPNNERRQYYHQREAFGSQAAQYAEINFA